MTVHSNSDDRDHLPTPNSPMDDDDSFEFFSLRRSPPSMCAADDVFFAGKILPFGAPPPPTRRAEHDHDQNPREAAAEDCEATQPSRQLLAGRGGVAKTNHQKPRSALDCEVAAKFLPPQPPAAPAASAKQRPRWYLYALGSMRVPTKMDVNEIRSRQQRRRCSSADATTSEPSVHANRGTWKLLQSLSCKGVESAGVSVAFVRDLQGV